MKIRSIPLGWLLVAWIVITALIALNRGIDLLWGVTLLIAVATLVAVFLPKFQVRGIAVRRAQFPATAVVGRTETIAYDVETVGWWPRYGIEIFDRLSGESHLQATAFLSRVRGASRHSFSWIPQQRGCWQLREVMIESRYPLGLTRARGPAMRPMNPQEIMVYPDFVPLRWLPAMNAAHPRFEQHLSPRRGGHDEFFGLRPYAAGDDRRSIHWRSTARLGELVAKEYEHQQDRVLWIVLDLAKSAHTGDGPHSTCEQMMRIAHSIAVKAHEEQLPVGLIYRVADTVQRVSAAADRATYLTIRDALARVNVHAQLPLVRWMERFREQLPSGGTWVVFNSVGERERLQLERIAAGRNASAVFIEFDKHSYEDASAPVANTAAIRRRATARSIVEIVPRNADLSALFKP